MPGTSTPGRPRLCATVLEATTREAIRVADDVTVFADLVEVRLDALADPDPAALVAAIARPVVFTCRPRGEGGLFDGSEADRLALLRHGIEAGAAFVDVELSAADRLGDRGRTRLIVSHHDLEGTPADLAPILDGMAAAGADVAKLVTRAREPADLVRVLAALRRPDVPVAAHTLDVAGRVLAARAGSAIVYGAARPGAAGAPGQPALRDLVGDYALDRDLRTAAVVLLLGGRLDHSVSPRMMNRTFAAEGVDALYVPYETDDPGPILAALGDLGAVGAAVTIPLKEVVAALVEEPGLSALNTVIVTDDGLRGANTDVIGALGAIRTAIRDLAGAKALVLGAGGAARAVVGGLVAAGARVLIANRTPSRAEDVAAAKGGTARALEDVEPAGLALVVNATPVGQWPDTDALPLPVALLAAQPVVFDAVYNPEETRLLGAARRAGCAVVPGIEMLARQAAEQVRLWLDRGVPVERLRDEGRRALRARHRTVVLVGMRGAGKTAVGEVLARRLGRPFVDLDAVVAERAGREVPAIFAEEGEAAFRRREAEALEDAITRSGVVLAVGGGIVETPAARDRIAGAPVEVVWLDAPAEVLAARIRDSDRPAITDLPPGDEVRTLLARREGGYRELAGHVVDAAAAGPGRVADSVLATLGF